MSPLVHQIEQSACPLGGIELPPSRAGPEPAVKDDESLEPSGFGSSPRASRGSGSPCGTSVVCTIWALRWDRRPWFRGCAAGSASGRGLSATPLLSSTFRFRGSDKARLNDTIPKTLGRYEI